MGYRGDDLDLRTPQTWNAGTEIGGSGQPERARRSGSPARGGPIWVEDAVLAACNHAFEIAMAHRSEEVRIEHLLNALTRIEPASEILQSRAIRVAQLRRDSATTIASEIPISTAPQGTPPRRSHDLAEVLRLAAAEAARRNAPAGVADILAVLLDGHFEGSGMALLARSSGARTIHEPAEPPLRTVTYAAEPRYTDRDPPRDWERRSQTTYVRTGQDVASTARMEGIERSLDSIGANLDDDRGRLHGLIHDLRREMAGHREEQSRIGGSLGERLNVLEQLVSSQPASRSDDKFFAQLRAIEAGVERRLAEMSRLASHQPLRDDDRVLSQLKEIEGGIDQRLGDLTRAWSTLGDRLQAVEHALREPRPAPIVDLAPIEARIAATETVIRESRTAEQQAWLGFTDRLKGVETALTSPGTLVDLAPVSHRLDIIEEALLGHDSEPTRELAERTHAIEVAVAALRAQSFETSSSLAAEIKALAGAVSTQASQSERIQSVHGERLQALVGLVDRHRTELAGMVAEPVLNRMQGLANVLEARHGQVGQHFTAVEQRVAAIERTLTDRVTAFQQTMLARVSTIEQSVRDGLAVLDRKVVEESGRARTAQGGIDQALSELGDALVRIHATQQRIVGDVEKWHVEAAGDISVVANKLETMERESAKPLRMIEAMSTGIDRMQRWTVEREYRRSRFWYWLFGTDDWQAASWPATVASVERKRSGNAAKRA